MELAEPGKKLEIFDTRHKKKTTKQKRYHRISLTLKQSVILSKNFFQNP